MKAWLMKQKEVHFNICKQKGLKNKNAGCFVVKFALEGRMKEAVYLDP